ncbi:hypothetical protein BJX99DRAFT_251481 [Aspergillus californicus]
MEICGIFNCLPLTTQLADPIPTGQSSSDTHVVTGGTVAIDRSNYWAPALYHESIGSSYAVYYLNQAEWEWDGNQSYPLAPPAGLRIIAADPRCLQADGTLNQTKHPVTAVFETEVSLFFPSCWDGKNLDSLDYKSHVCAPLPSDDLVQSKPVESLMPDRRHILQLANFKNGTCTGVNWLSDSECSIAKGRKRLRIPLSLKPKGSAPRR